MTTVYSDILELLPRVREEMGTVVELTRNFRVDGLPNASSDYQALDEALADAGVPAYGEAAPGDSNLVCVERSAEPERNSPTKAYIRCRYIPQGLIAFPANSGIRWSGGGGLSQIETQNDVNGDPITVTYTYPTTGNYKNEDVAPHLVGNTYTKGATIRPSIPEPTINPTFELTVFDPLAVQLSVQGYVNQYFWAGGGAREWLCQAMDWELINDDGLIPTWRFRGQFQRRFATWDEQVWYTDDHDESIPPDLASYENAVKTPVHHYETDFGYYFPV